MSKRTIAIIFLYLIHIYAYSQSRSITNRWVISSDPLIQIPVLNLQKNNKDEKLPLGKDWIQGFGIEMLKYYPNKNNFLVLNTRFFQREAIIDKIPANFIRENGIQINMIFNKSHIDKTPKYLDITKPFVGIGVSYTGILNKQLHYFSTGYVQTSKELFNNHRIELLTSLGILEDVFNISNKTSLSKFNVVCRLPIFNSSNTFNNDYAVTDPEIEEFIKSNNRKISLEIQYAHFFDVRKNRIGNYETKLDTTWKEVADPLKKIIPPIVNNGLPRNNFYGNFYFEIIGFRSQDFIFITERNENFALFKRFNGYGIGYTLNFSGNHKKDYSDRLIGGGIYNFDKGWRRNLFVSAGYKQLILKADKKWVTFDMFAPIATARAGIKLRNSKNMLEIAGGAGYQKILSPQTFINHTRAATPSLPTSSVFGAIGYKNNLIKIEYEMVDFNFFDLYRSFNIVYSIGI